MCKKAQYAKGLQALSIRGYTLQLYLDNFILGYAGLSFFNNKEKDGLYMNQTSIIPNHVSENAIFDKDTGWRIDIPSCIEPGTRVLCLYRVSTDKQLYQTDNNEADIPMQRSPVVGTNVRHSGRSRDSGAYDSDKHNNRQHQRLRVLIRLPPERAAVFHVSFIAKPPWFPHIPPSKVPARTSQRRLLCLHSGSARLPPPCR